MNRTKAEQEATPEDVSAAIIARPKCWDPMLLRLAQAYESQRERIADLEDDVERLRPREAFVPEVLFDGGDSDGDHMLVESDSHGHLSVIVGDFETDRIYTLDKNQILELTTALAKWAGLPSGVEWRSVDDPPSLGGPVLLAGGEAVSPGFRHHDGVWNWGAPGQPTHWAPLPKPPVKS